MSSNVTIRKTTPKDAAVCGQICFDAFCAVNRAHGFPPDFPSSEVTIEVLTMMFTHPSFYSVVAESEGRVVGSNCLDERSIVVGVGPITVNPTAQNLGVGRKLMEAVIDRAQSIHAPGIRLVQAAFHNRSLSLYTNLGFDVREPLACMQGRTEIRSLPGCLVRPAEAADLATCDALARQVHGFDRSNDLLWAIEKGQARVVERSGRITAYTNGLSFFGHATAETNLDLQALIASAESFGGPGILVPIRNSALFRWCLANGLRIVEPMTLMSIGLYNEPAGAFLPSISF